MSGAAEDPGLAGGGLRPRPVIEGDVLAVLAAAVEAAWPRAARLEAPVEQPAYLAWRFSGRWWARPSVARRDRPVRLARSGR